MEAARERGLFLAFAPDSTRCRAGDTVRAVPAADVRSFVTDRQRLDPRTGLLLGGGAFVGLTALACGGSLDLASDCYATAIPAGLVAGGILFTGHTLIVSPPRTYPLVE